MILWVWALLVWISVAMAPFLVSIICPPKHNMNCVLMMPAVRGALMLLGWVLTLYALYVTVTTSKNYTV